MFEFDKLKDMANRAADITQDAREQSERCRDYYDGYQITASEAAELKRRRQPIIKNNRIRRKVDAMVGLEQRQRVDPVAHPREPGDEDAADVATKALRYVEEIERIDQIRSDAFYNLVIEGYGGCEVVVEPGRPDFEVKVRKLRWEEIFFDPHSREKDFSDASYLGIYKWMSRDKAHSYLRPMFEGSDEDFDALLDVQSPEIGQTYNDRPFDENGELSWIDRKQQRVRVAQMYYQYGGVWHYAVFTGRGEVFNDVSPYLDEKGKPTNAMILMSAYVDRDNQRYGPVVDWIDMQDEINKRRSKMLHFLNSRQTMGIQGAVTSVAALKRELAAPDGHIEISRDVFMDALGAGVRPFELLPNQDQIAGQAQLLSEAKQEIDMLGPNASLQGQLQGDQSGRAILAQQQAGMAELAPIYDALRDWTERVYRAAWNRIRQFWQAPRWIRITGDEEAPQFVGINQVVMTEQGPAMQNPVAQIDVDIIISTAPEMATLQHEQFEKLAELASSGMVQIPPQVLIKASSLHDKKELMDLLQPPPEVQQLQQRAQMADLMEKEAKAQKMQAEAMQIMASIPGYRAEFANKQADTAKKQAETAKIASEAVVVPFQGNSGFPA